MSQQGNIGPMGPIGPIALQNLLPVRMLNEYAFCPRYPARDDELKARMHQDEDQTLFVDAGPVEGERPVPEIAYLGKVWRPEQRTQVV